MSYETKNEGANPNTEVAKQLARIGAEMKTAMETQAAEIKASGETSTKTAREIEALGTKYEKLETETKARLDEIQAKAGRLPESEEAERKSIGAQFVESEEFKSAPRSGNLGRVSVEVKAITSADGSAGVLTNPQRLAYRALPTEAHVRDLFAQGQTSQNSIEFPQIQAFTNNAKAVYDDGVMVKPESDLILKLTMFPVRTIAHLMRVHRSILADAPALRSIIDAQMTEGLQAAEDVQLIKGDGVGENIKGVLAYARPFTRAAVGDTKLDVLRRAQTDLRLKNYAADGFLLNPLDWEDIELLKGTDGRYVWATVTGVDGVTRVWRTNVVDSAAIDEGQFVAGAFKRGGQIFDREQATIEMFDQDRDNVTKNLITIRVEERVSLVVFDVNAFVKGTFAV